MRVAVVGATGVLGRHVVPRLLERGHEVSAVVRSPEAYDRLTRLGARPHLGDILEPETLAAALAGCHSALHLATAVLRPGATGDWSPNDRIRRDGTANLLAACRATGVRRYVQQSIAMLHAGAGRDVIDEDAPLFPSPVTRSSVDMEAMVRASGLEWCILRGGAFYGPETGRDAHWRTLAGRGELRLPGDGGDFLSLVHVSDMAAAVVVAAEAAPAGSVFAVVDDAPVTYAELFAYVATLEGAAPPQAGGPPIWGSFRLSNARLRKALDWRPHYPSYRSGLA